MTQTTQEPPRSALERPLLAGTLRDDTRVEIEREVAFSFNSLQGFVREYSLNISATGMFIRTRQPQPVGSVLFFELALVDGRPLIRGRAEVMWIRRFEESLDRPAGMGMRFVDLDRESRQLIRWVLSHRHCADDQLVDLDQIRSAVERAAPGVAADAEGSKLRQLSSFAGSAVPIRRRSGGSVLLRTVLAAVLGGGALALLAGSSVSGRGAAATAPAVETPAAIETPAVVATPAEGTPAMPDASPNQPAEAADVVAPPAASDGPAPTLAATEARLTAVVRAWALAWSQQRVDDYLHLYAAGFHPPENLSREDWQALRRTRILRPRNIDVELADLEVTALTGERAVVSFVQTYRSDSYRDVVRKRLYLVREDGVWKILAERAEDL